MIHTDAPTVIYLSANPYHFTWQSSHSLCEQFARRGWRVIFVDPLPKRLPRLGEWARVWGRLRGDSVRAGLMRQREFDGLHIVLPRSLPDRGALFRWINRRVLLPRLAHRLRRDCPTLPLVIVALPTRAALDLLDLLQPDKIMYKCVLNFTKDPLMPLNAAKTEREVVRRADLIQVDQGLDNRERIASYQPTCPVIPGGATVKYDLFAPARTPRPISGAPICCYFGDVRANVDLALLRKVSERFPLHIIGTKLETLRNFPTTTRLIPAVPHGQLPALLAQVDILLLPYRRDDPYNRGVFPAKIYECLATGKPVIASGLESLHHLRSVIDLADDDDAFLDAIDRAAQQANAPDAAERRERRLAAAREYDEQAAYGRWFAAIEAVVAGAPVPDGSGSARR
jgi:glycosyltransferase involved in cell wall biosynthesis